MLSAKSRAEIIGISIITVVVGALVFLFYFQDYYSHPEFSYKFKSVDCSQEAKDARNKIPRGELDKVFADDSCVITLVVTNHGETFDDDDYMAIGGGPAGSLENPPIKMYSGDRFCYALPSQYGFEPRSSTEVQLTCMGSNLNDGHDTTVDERPTRIVINARGKSVFNL